jgi:DNA polymerase-1
MPLNLQDANDLFLRGTLALAKVEQAGIRIDMSYLDRQIEKTGKQIIRVREELRADPIFAQWRQRFGNKANLGSGEQLAVMMFDVLGYKSKGKTATGKYKCDEEAFAHIDLPFLRKYFRGKKLEKIKGTYLEGVREEVVGEFIHPNFDLHTTITYRSSSSNINFQNVPIRDPILGRLIRRAFINRDGHAFIEIDYGSMEFIIAACFWLDPVMMDYAADPKKNVHKDMATKLFLCTADQVEKPARDCAKNQFTFPTLYGSWWKKMAAGIWNYIEQYNVQVGGKPAKEWLAAKGITELGDAKEDPPKHTYEWVVKRAEDWFNTTFSVFAEKKDAWYAEYRKNGGFRLNTGFWCGGLYSRNQCMNFPIQGPAFHCLLLSLIKLQRWLEKKQMRAQIVAQIHDCLLIDTPVEELQDVLTKARRIMADEIRKEWEWVTVDLKAEVDVTPPDSNWHEKKPWDCINGVWQPKA